MEVTTTQKNTAPMGHVSVNERVPDPAFGHYVEERMTEWIESRDLMPKDAPEVGPEDATDFEVAFYDEEALGEISCLIVVQSGAQLWRAWESADSQEEALERSLANLHSEDAEIVTERASVAPTITPTTTPTTAQH